jgi:hypothetical protein
MSWVRAGNEKHRATTLNNGVEAAANENRSTNFMGPVQKDVCPVNRRVTGGHERGRLK